MFSVPFLCHLHSAAQRLAGTGEDELRINAVDCVGVAAGLRGPEGL